jgi:hypothetical protein
MVLIWIPDRSSSAEPITRSDSPTATVPLVIATTVDNDLKAGEGQEGTVAMASILNTAAAPDATTEAPLASPIEEVVPAEDAEPDQSRDAVPNSQLSEKAAPAVQVSEEKKEVEDTKTGKDKRKNSDGGKSRRSTADSVTNAVGTVLTGAKNTG